MALLQTHSATNVGITPATITMGNTTTGSLVIVGTVYGAASGTGIVTSITATGMSFTKILDVSAQTQAMSLWYAFNITGATTPTITVNFNDSFSDLSAIAREYSGLTTTDPLDKSHSASGSSVNANSGATLTTAQASELIIGIITDGFGSAQTYTVGAGYGNLTSVVNTNSDNISLEDKTVVATGTQTSTLTLGNTAGWIAGVATFKLKTGTAYTQSLTGGLSFTGNTSNTTKYPLTGALSFSGAISKFINYVVSGSLSFAGAIQRSTSYILSSGASFVGSLTKNTSHSFTAIGSFTGQFSKQTNKSLPGGLTFTGNLNRAISRIVTGSAGFVGVLTKNVSNPLTGVLSFVGATTASHTYNRTLLGVLSFSSGYKATILGDSPQLYWRLGETSGTTAQDSSGNGHTGTYTQTIAGGFTLNQTSLLVGDSDPSVKFTRANGGHVQGAGVLTGQTGARSFEAWIKGTDYSQVFSSNRGLMGDQNNAANTTGWYFYNYNNFFVFGCHDTALGFNSAVQSLASSVPSTSGPAHIVGTWDGLKTFKIYINGVLSNTAVTSQNVVPNASTVPFSAGYSTVNGANYWDGVMDEVAVYTYALSPSQITAHYQAGLGELTKATNKALTAGLSFTGNISRLLTYPLTGSISFAGSILKQSRKGISGALNFTGLAVTGIARSVSLVAATIGFSGSFVKNNMRAYAASLGFTGNLNRTVSKILPASLSFVGVLARSISKAFSATASFSGNLGRRITRAITGSLSFSGVYTWGIIRGMSSNLSFTGSMQRLSAKTFTGGLNFAGNLSKASKRTLSSAVGFVGDLSRQIRYSLAAGVDFAGAILRQGSKSFNSVVSFTGLFNRGLLKPFTGSINFTGGLRRAITHQLQGSVSFIGAMRRLIPQSFGSTLSFTGSFLGAKISEALARVYFRSKNIIVMFATKLLPSVFVNKRAITTKFQATQLQSNHKSNKIKVVFPNQPEDSD